MGKQVIFKNAVEDIAIAEKQLADIPRDWQGKKCVLELKEADYNWRQMEWWGFYFEWQCARLLQPEFIIPGDRIDDRVVFDAKRTITWDFKAKAIKSDQHDAILNDTKAIDMLIERDGAYGAMIAMCDVEYNDADRSFQKWHTELKGGLSNYEKNRILRTSTSRYRKTSAQLEEILFIIVTSENIEMLDIMKQGRNSNGKPRPTKYKINLEQIDPFLQSQLKFG